MKAERLFTRNFTFLILGQISSLLGNYTLKFALSMYILEQTGSASVFAAMLAVAMLPTILCLPSAVYWPIGPIAAGLWWGWTVFPG